jgi:hypothetical protein
MGPACGHPRVEWKTDWWGVRHGICVACREEVEWITPYTKTPTVLFEEAQGDRHDHGPNEWTFAEMRQRLAGRYALCH